MNSPTIKHISKIPIAVCFMILISLNANFGIFNQTAENSKSFKNLFNST
jgi:hypothetical protein